MPGMEDLYREIILDHYRSPRNKGELPVPPAHPVTGYNPLCGDEVTLYLDVDGGVLKDIKINGQGCSISQSSASLMSTVVKARTLSEVRDLLASFKAMMSIREGTLSDQQGGDPGAGAQLFAVPDGAPSASAAQDAAGGGADAGHSPATIEDLGELAALQGVVKFPVRIKCATLPWNTLLQGLDEMLSGRAPAEDGGAGTTEPEMQREEPA